MAYFVDTSALAKLVLDEPETDALQAWVPGKDLTTSDFACMELTRVVRKNAPDRESEIEVALEGIYVAETEPEILAAAARLEPRTVKSLDAVHLASALQWGINLDGLVTYDRSLASAARFNGVTVVAPNDRPLEFRGQSLQISRRVA